jgi:hypothetical protein
MSNKTTYVEENYFEMGTASSENETAITLGFLTLPTGFLDIDDEGP